MRSKDLRLANLPFPILPFTLLSPPSLSLSPSSFAPRASAHRVCVLLVDRDLFVLRVLVARFGQTAIKWRCVCCSEDGDSGHSGSSWVRVRANLSIDASMALAAGTTECASIVAAAAEKFKAVIREAAAKAA